MQFVQSVPVAEVLATEGNIQVMQYILVVQSSSYPSSQTANQHLGKIVKSSRLLR